VGDATPSDAGVGAPLRTDLPLQEARRRVVDDFERAYLRTLLEELAGNVGEVARRARINPRTLYDKMRRLGLRKEDFRV
jgi:DNA-binding NtrC family response regulator